MPCIFLFVQVACYNFAMDAVDRASLKSTLHWLAWKLATAEQRTLKMKPQLAIVQIEAIFRTVISISIRLPPYWTEPQFKTVTAAMAEVPWKPYARPDRKRTEGVSLLSLIPKQHSQLIGRSCLALGHFREYSRTT